MIFVVYLKVTSHVCSCLTVLIYTVQSVDLDVNMCFVERQFVDTG